MPIISASIDTFLATAAIAGTSTHFILRRTQAKSQSPYRDALTLFVLLHTLYIVYVTTLRYPPNLFRTLRLSLNTPSDHIRSIIQKSAGLEPNAVLPQPLETLLTRLSSFEGRNTYLRFGQSVVQNCEFCRTQEHYALFALPGPLLQYAREAAVIGTLTLKDSHRGHWRGLGILFLVVACAVEVYYTLQAQIIIPRDGKGAIFWADNFWLGRQAMFLILPILVHSLPPKVPVNSVALMLQTRAMLESASRRVTLSKYMRGAIIRDPALRASSLQWWDKQKLVGKWVREDEAVQMTAEKLDSGFTEGMGNAAILPKLRTIAETMFARIDPNAGPDPIP